METHLFDADQKPQYLKNFKHHYHVCESFASTSDTHAGIMVFINKKYQLLKEETLIEGRLLFTQVKNNNNLIQNFFYYYGPHKNMASREAHITIAQNYITTNSLEEIFFLGDFNYTTSNLDNNSNILRFPTVAKNWLVFEQNNAIFDTFRHRCPKRRLYSNTHKKNIKTRIDRIYVPSTIIDQIKTTLFHETETKGHRVVEAQVFKDIENGPGNWCFKNSLLKDEDYINLINNKIRQYQNLKKEF